MSNASLSIGATAPDFTMQDVHGSSVRLQDHKNSYVLLAFLRYSGCPFCNLAVHRLTLEQPILKDSKCDIIAFIQSEPSAIEKNIFQRHKLPPNFPIIPDPAMSMYKKYGVVPSVLSTIKHTVTHLPAWVNSVFKEGYAQESVDGNGFIAPATFLLARDSQKIIRVDYDANLYDHQSFTNIYDAIQHHQIYGFDQL